MNVSRAGFSRSRWAYPLIGVFGILIGVGVMSLALDILRKKEEAKVPFFRVVELSEDTEDPAVWGRNFPHQYDSYMRTVDQVRTKYGGSEAVPRSPTQADPRSLVAQSRLAEDPRLKIMWAGYPFSVDFREERGHAYMLTDQIFTERQRVSQQPGACLNCHASVYVPFRKAGGGDLTKGFDALNRMTYQEAVQHVRHPITCLDCHDSSTMRLRVTRPAFIEGIKKVKGLQGVRDFEVNTMSTHQEMRTFVCAQCHVEYYFKGSEKRLTFPWGKGLRGTDILAVYEENGHKDWVHSETGAPVLKAQHPEFEMFSQGAHARSGVSCADCHMPYQRVGAMKISDHHVRSPLLNVNRACQTCHKQPEAELLAKVDVIQTNTFNMRGVAMDALVELIRDIKDARGRVEHEGALDEARGYQRRAQFLLDFVEAENSMGFHAPQEALRLLGESIDNVRKGQLSVRKALR